MRPLTRQLRSTALLLCVACAPALPRGGSEEPVRHPDQITVDVTNQHASAVVVYAVRSGTRYRLGLVPSMSRATLPVPHGVVAGTGRLQLLASLTAGRQEHVAEPLLVGPGQQVMYRVNDSLFSSYALVRER